MAISYDSNGNPQVDFAWGNMPLQGNAQRGVVEPVVKQTYNYQPDWDGSGGIFAINLASATEVNAGWTITATAGPSTGRITKKFTVESVSMGSPGYYVHTKEAYDQEFATAIAVTMTGEFITSIAPALNRGGGAGDKGWSQTTLVKSPELDPALDNHVLATNGWNGYPGYTPGISVPPLATLLEFTTASVTAGGASGLSVQAHNGSSENGSIWYNGFTISVSDPMGLGIEDLVQDWSALKTAIDNNTLSGAGITFNNWTSQYGTPDFNGVDGKLKVIGGWYTVDSYGNNVLVLSIVPTVPGDAFGLNDPYIFSGMIPVGVSIKITERAAAPTLQFVQDDSYNYMSGGDQVNAYINWSNYDGILQIYVGNGITPEQETALTTNSVGKNIGMGKLSTATIFDWMQGANNPRSYDVVKSVAGPFQDSYNNLYYEVATEHGYAIQGIWAQNTGDTLVIL